MTIATIDVWADDLSNRSCHIRLFEKGCALELHALGRCAMTMEFGSVPAAMKQADAWRPDYTSPDYAIAQPTAA
jgi:hypothetical protein